MSSIRVICSRGSITYMNGLDSVLTARSTRVAAPPLPPMRPQHSSGASARAWAINSSASAAGRITPGPLLPEHAVVEGLLDIVDLAGPDAGGQVLPATVAHDSHDGAALHPRRHANAGVEHRAA